MSMIFLSLLLLASAVAKGQEIQNDVYKQEFALVKENPILENLFNQDAHPFCHHLELKIQNYIAVPNKWQRFACFLLLEQDAIAVSQKYMPKLASTIENLAQKADIQTPVAFITIQEGSLNAVAIKLLKGIGCILIEQKTINELTDGQLEAVIAHEMGHIKYEHVNKNLALLIPTFFISLYLSHKAMTFGKSKLPDNKLINWVYWIFGGARYIGIHEYSLGMLSAALTTYMVRALVFGKDQERQADAFACQMGYASELAQTMELFESKEAQFDQQIIAVNDKLISEQSNLTPPDFIELQQGIEGTKMWVAFGRWVQAKTPFLSHPPVTDRIAAAQAYLDAQEAEQAAAIEKA